MKQKGGDLFPDSLEITVRSRKSCPLPFSAEKKGGMGREVWTRSLRKTNCASLVNVFFIS